MPYVGNAGGVSRGLCPLCRRQDSATHILGECHAHHAIRIQRHDAAARCLIKHIRKGTNGAYHIIADVGSKERLEPFGITEKVIPEWILPGGRAMSRLDIVMPHVLTANVVPKRRLRKGLKVTAIELGFRADHDPEGRKILEKQRQHQDTTERLQRRYDVDYQVWDIGYTGIIPQRMCEQAKRLGVANVPRLMKELHAIAIEHAHMIVQQRRHMEQHLIPSSAHDNRCTDKDKGAKSYIR
jgi:hypothetical protein